MMARAMSVQFLVVSPGPKVLKYYQIFIERLVSEQNTYNMILLYEILKKCKLTYGDRKVDLWLSGNQGGEENDCKGAPGTFQGVMDAFIVLIV